MDKYRKGTEGAAAFKIMIHNDRRLVLGEHFCIHLEEMFPVHGLKKSIVALGPQLFADRFVHLSWVQEPHTTADDLPCRSCTLYSSLISLALSYPLTDALSLALAFD